MSFNVPAISETRELGGEDFKLKAIESGEPLKDVDDDGFYPRRDGTVWTCVAHVITVVIGAGVLSLGWCVAQLGWVFGPLMLFLFACLTMLTADMLCDSYRSGDPFIGQRNRTYSAAVEAHLGKWHQRACAAIQYFTLFLCGIGYVITSSVAVVAAKRTVCFHTYAGTPAEEAPCSFDSTLWTVLFGGIAVICSQIPNFGHLWWLSYMASALSFLYAFIGLGLGIGQSTERGHPDYGTVLGVNTARDPTNATWQVFTALGNMASAYSYTLVLVEVADTLKQPDLTKANKDGKQPESESQVMKKASRIAIILTTLFYLAIACTSYAGFGNDSPGNLLTGFGFFNPYWLVAAANIFVFVHMIGGYQVLMQPLMAAIERLIRKMFPNVAWIHYEVWYDVPILQHVVFSPLLIVARTSLVIITVIIGCLLPFFNVILGLVGAFAYAPLTVYFPIQIYLIRNNVPKTSAKYIALQALCFLGICVAICSVIGSVAGIPSAVKGYKPFHNQISSLGNGGNSA